MLQPHLICCAVVPCREQAKAVTLTCSVIAVDQGALVVPGERRLFDVTEQQLEQIIADRGQVRCLAGWAEAGCCCCCCFTDHITLVKQ
jgi:hypothetical protein